MIRFILLAAASWLIWHFVKKLGRSSPLSQSQSKNASYPLVKTKQRGKVVQCKYCGLYIPEAEAIHAGKAIFCCEEHQRIAQSQ